MKVERRFLLLISVGDQCGRRIDDEVGHAAVARMLDPTNVLELIIEGSQRWSCHAWREANSLPPRRRMTRHPPYRGDKLSHLAQPSELSEWRFSYGIWNLAEGRRMAPILLRRLAYIRFQATPYKAILSCSHQW